MKISKSYILLPKMKFYAHHGVDPQETVVGAEFTVGLKLKVDFTHALQTDELEGTVNYASIYESVKAEIKIPSKLLEHAAGRIAQRLLDDFPAIEQIELKLFKQNPPMGADCNKAGVEIIVER